MFNLDFVSKIYGFWGKTAVIYNLSNLLTYLGKEKYLRWQLISQLDLKGGSSVLDLACGNGSNFEIIQKFIDKTGHLYGFDYSKEMLQSADKRVKRNSWKNVKLKQGDAADLPYNNNSFDAVLSTLGISAIPDFISALNHAFRVLRKGGTMGILDAQLFKGFWRILNLPLKIIYTIGAAWDYTKDIIGEFKKRFSNIHLEKYNGGTLYILIGKKD